MKPEAPAYLGLDIGGQTVKGLRLEADGRISLRTVRPTPASKSAAAVLDAAREVVEELLGPGPAAALGAGTPGAVDAAGRIAGEAVNIPGWRGTELGEALAGFARAPARVRNDGNLAAYAEWAARGGRAKALLFVGLGTGIGGGFVEDGRILPGIDDRAVEIGHLIVHYGGRPCACGRSGCVETYASGPSIGKIAAELALKPEWGGSDLAQALRSPGIRADARAVYKAFAKGDELARAVHRIAAEALARAIASALALLAPDTVVLGGGVLAGAGALVEEVAALVPSYVYATACEGCRYERALLGPEAGLLGAALYGASFRLERPGFLELSRAALGQ
ncbi:MAG TPA: ROK family protein [Spirochaetales bacterium]|nr:ROK family protein [Spirochaetales bacterium]HRY55284.1 ROK family protein [Spirochaetia bacterium]HRZ63618.1 ROK family protein [Spirochaetia bacterium]